MLLIQPIYYTKSTCIETNDNPLNFIKIFYDLIYNVSIYFDEFLFLYLRFDENLLVIFFHPVAQRTPIPLQKNTSIHILDICVRVAKECCKTRTINRVVRP